MSQPDFDRKLYLEPLTGMRTFRVTKTGALIGAVIPVKFGVGENVAACVPPFATGYTHPGGKPIASVDCTCGFYAYFKAEGGDQYYDDPTMPPDINQWMWGKGPDHNVLGLIEGYGLLSVGNRGFRASKARLRCLVEPPSEAAVIPCMKPHTVELRRRFDLTRAAYDGIPVVPTIEDALKRWPLTPVEVKK